MTDRKLLEQALEALEDIGDEWGFTSQRTLPKRMKAIEALRERLAQPQRTHWEGCDEVHPECRKQEQEPVAWMYVNMDGECEQIEYLENEPLPDDPSITPLYATPQRREWVGLTDEEIMEPWPFENRVAFARWLEAKLKEKNT